MKVNKKAVEILHEQELQEYQNLVWEYGQTYNPEENENLQERIKTNSRRLTRLTEKRYQ